MKNVSEVRKSLAGRGIWLWHYMHADWQWEQSRLWHAERYALAVNEALDIMQSDPEFCYFFDSASEFFSAVEQRLGARLEELKDRVREGRVRVVSAQVANCRPTQVGDETYLRNIQLGRRYFEEHLPPTDLSLFHSVDIAIGGSQMPQILSQAGFKFYRAWRPHGPLNVLGIPHQFVWEGIDGSQILVTRGSYGGGLGDSPLAHYSDDWDAAVLWVYEQYFHDQIIRDRSRSDQLWMIQGADDARPLRNWLADQPEDLQGFVAAWREREGVPIHWCTPLEFSRAVAEQADKLPVVKGVLDGADCGYNMANHGANGLWVWRQMNDRRLLRAEWFATAARTAAFDFPRERFEQLWYDHCTYQAHAQDAGFRADWEYLRERARHVQYEAEGIAVAAIHAIVHAAGGGTRTTRYVLNPLPWAVEADVAVYHPCVEAGVESLQIVDETGAPLVQQQLAEFRHPRFDGSVNDERRLVRVKLPPLGYRRLEIVERPDPGPARQRPPEDGVVEAGDLRLVYRDHALREVRDLTGDHKYASREGGPWPGLFFHVLSGQGWPFDGPEMRRERFEPESSEWLQAGPLRWQHRCVGRLGPYEAWIDTTVDQSHRELHISAHLEGNWKQPLEAGFVTLLADVEAGGSVTVDVPFAVEPRDPDNDYYVGNVPGEQDLGISNMIERLRPGVFWARSWADWAGEGHGFTLVSSDGSTYWLKEPGQIGHILLRCVQSTPGTWEEFCPQSFGGSGTHGFSYTICFHDCDWRAADPQRRSLELRYPPVVARADHEAQAKLPGDRHTFLHVDGPALISAYYAVEDGVILRLYENEGTGGDVAVTFDWEPAAAQFVDLLGNQVDGSIKTDGRIVSFSLRPWQIATLRIETREQGE